MSSMSEVTAAPAEKPKANAPQQNGTQKARRKFTMKVKKTSERAEWCWMNLNDGSKIMYENKFVSLVFL